MFKKFLSIFILGFLSFALVACGGQPQATKTDNTKQEIKKEEVKTDNIKKEENKTDNDKKEPKEQSKETSNTLTIGKIKADISEVIGDKDSILNVAFDNKVINIKIKLGDAKPLTPKDLALSRYGSISDKLLGTNGWNTLKVTFENVGTISMDESKAVEKTESGMKLKYFKTLDYENQLK